MSELYYSPEIKEKITKELGFCPTEIIPPSGFRVLLKIFTRDEVALLPDGTKSSILLADVSKDLDKFTSCVGLVISMNPGCYKDEERYKLTGPNCELGDWVIYPRNNGVQSVYRGHPVVDIFEDFIIRRVPSPLEVRRD